MEDTSHVADLSDDDRLTFTLLADAERQYETFLEAAAISRIPLADDYVDDIGFVPAPLTFALRREG
jgi:hypothetical protein